MSFLNPGQGPRTVQRRAPGPPITAALSFHHRGAQHKEAEQRFHNSFLRSSDYRVQGTGQARGRLVSPGRLQGGQQCGRRGQCVVPIPAGWGRQSPRQASPRRVPASRAKPGSARGALTRSGRTALPAGAAPPGSPTAPGQPRGREEVEHVAVRKVARLRAGGRGSRGLPLRPAGLRKILLGQWQAGRRARIGAGALLITVETPAAANAGGCGAAGGGSRRGGRRRRRGPEQPRSFNWRRKSPADWRAEGGAEKATAWGQWEAGDIPVTLPSAGEEAGGGGAVGGGGEDKSRTERGPGGTRGQPAREAAVHGASRSAGRQHGEGGQPG